MKVSQELSQIGYCREAVDGDNVDFMLREQYMLNCEFNSYIPYTVNNDILKIGFVDCLFFTGSISDGPQREKTVFGVSDKAGLQLVTSATD